MSNNDQQNIAKITLCVLLEEIFGSVRGKFAEITAQLEVAQQGQMFLNLPVFP